MRNLLAFAAAVVIVFLGLGWYFDWYKVNSVPTATGHQSYSIDINESKIGKDVQTFEKSIEKKNQQHDVNATTSKGFSGSAVPAANGTQPKIVIEADDAPPTARMPMSAPQR